MRELPFYKKAMSVNGQDDAKPTNERTKIRFPPELGQSSDSKSYKLNPDTGQAIKYPLASKMRQLLANDGQQPINPHNGE